MIPLHPIRSKGGAPLLGAGRPGEAGPFGRWPLDDEHPEMDDEDDQLAQDL